MNKIIIGRTIVAIAIMVSALFFTSLTHAQNTYSASGSLSVGAIIESQKMVVQK